MSFALRVHRIAVAAGSQGVASSISPVYQERRQCPRVAAQEQPKDEKENCGGWLKKCDSNNNGKLTCAEVRARGLKTPIKKDHPA